MPVEEGGESGDFYDVDAVGEDGHEGIVAGFFRGRLSTLGFMSESVRKHEEQAAARAKRDPVRCAVLTVSDTRTVETDESGDCVVEILEKGGHLLVDRAIVPDEPGQVETRVRGWIEDGEIQAVLITGGTGIGRRDGTVEVVERLLTKPLEGFGELFRMLSYEEVGAAAMMSRAVGGLTLVSEKDEQGTFLFTMPGSVNAVMLAMERLIGPQLAHLVWERRR